MATHENDFCSTGHRVRFHARLRKALAAAAQRFEGPPAVAGPRSLLRPRDTQATQAICLQIRYDSGRGCVLAPLRLSVDAGAPISIPTPAALRSAHRLWLLPSQDDAPSRDPRPGEAGLSPHMIRPAGTTTGDRMAELSTRLEQLRCRLERAALAERQLATA